MSVDLFQAIADPHRRLLLEILRQGERASGELAEALPITAGAVSQHLKVLREAGLVAVRKVGRRRLYRATPARLSEVEDWIAAQRAAWEDRLDILEALVAEEQR